MSEVPGEITLDQLNRMPAPIASQALSAVCSSERWVGALLAGRPYVSVDAVLERSDAAVGVMSEGDLRAALEGHPRIGERRAEGWSGQEQAGVNAEDAELARALGVANAAYEQRFGHIYLVCATGRSGRELMQLLLERLNNDRATEWRVVSAELAKINQIRLRKLVRDVPTPRAGCGLSTHVLDTVKGEPAAGVVVRLEVEGREIGRGTTDGDGRISDFGAGPLGAGVYRLAFETDAYFGSGEAFFPEVVVTFRIDGRRPKYHVPLLLNTYSYSTYRGS